MTYVVIGYDGKDEQALERRMNARPRHLEYSEALKAEGKVTYGVALLNDDKKMIGSIYVLNVEKKEDVDMYLKNEPYVIEGVWKDITVHEGMIGKSFLK